ncbi:MAG: deoxyguanosinetriphosphate triphosphohydrolase [Candidatus Choladocola sp.]|nr:deoxyguanosinetriphosphate triphosphohydrolase [Candidatus Choladocola sp.]
MEWRTLLSPERSRSLATRSPGGRDLRSEFEKDYHRIIGSASFRRLQDKTQVFPLDQSDFIRTRLTHSLEVSSIAKSLGQNISQDILQNGRDPQFDWQMKEDACNILLCAGLIHDIGNPPFGHFGESAIREWFTWNLPKLKYKGNPVTKLLSKQMLADFYNFEGNAQALRLLSKLHFLVDENGMNLTYGLLSTIIKYPVPSTAINPHSGDIREKKMGYFLAEQDLYEKITAATGTGGLRHPLTFILEAADDIAYKTADIEDAFKKGCISYSVLLKELEQYEEKAPQREKDYFNPARILREKYAAAEKRHVSDKEEFAVQNFLVRVQGFLISCATYGFLNNYRQIMEGSYHYDLFEFTYARGLMKLLGDVAYRHAFVSNPIYKLEIAADTVLNSHLDRFVSAALYYDTEVPQRDVEEKLMSLISENYKQAYHAYSSGKSEEERLYLRLLLVTDYVCGMTDSYAKRLYQELNGII